MMNILAEHEAEYISQMAPYDSHLMYRHFPGFPEINITDRTIKYHHANKDDERVLDPDAAFPAAGDGARAFLYHF